MSDILSRIVKPADLEAIEKMIPVKRRSVGFKYDMYLARVLEVITSKHQASIEGIAPAELKRIVTVVDLIGVESHGLMKRLAAACTACGWCCSQTKAIHIPAGEVERLSRELKKKKEEIFTFDGREWWVKNAEPCQWWNPVTAAVPSTTFAPAPAAPGRWRKTRTASTPWWQFPTATIQSASWSIRCWGRWRWPKKAQPMLERVAIMGGGGSSYLYRLLRQRRPDVEVTLFDRPSPNPCGAKGCAWGLARPLFTQLCANIGFVPGKYVFESYDHVIVNGRLKADLVIIDKPAMLKDLIDGAELMDPSNARLEDFDRVIDATGSERAFLPKISATPIVSALQVRLKVKAPEAPTAVFNPGGGYSWLFPIGSDEVHLGSLSPWGYDAARKELQSMMEKSGRSKAECSCRGEIRCHGPVAPFVEGKIWGLGEAIGLVDPVTGAGIVPAMVSAGLLLDNWDSPPAYEHAVLRRYSYMTKEASVLNNLAAGRPLSSSDLFFPKQALETIGLKPGFFDLVALVTQAARDYLKLHAKRSPEES